MEILAAQQTFTNTSWYQGTADAVRKNLIHFLNHDFDYLLILSGDQLYRMDFRRVIDQHAETGADITVATIPVNRTDAQSLGIMQIGEDRRITRFVEKPNDPAVLDSLRLPPEWYPKLGIEGERELFLASMGIYVFNRTARPRTAGQSPARLRQTHHSARHQHPPCLLLYLSGLLGGHRHHPHLF